MTAKPDSQKPSSGQRALAGEFYVCSLLCRMGYDVALTLGNAKAVDITVYNNKGKAICVQVKTTLKGHDWLVGKDFPSRGDILIALVRLGEHLDRNPELYVLRPEQLVVEVPSAKHAPRVRRSAVTKAVNDHDLSPIRARLGSA